MNVIMADIEGRLTTRKFQEPVPNVYFGKVLYADDTMIFSTSTRHLSRLLQEIEAESAYYGLNLNMQKCENLTINQIESNVRFTNNEVVPRVRAVTYLGVRLVESTSSDLDLSTKIGQCKSAAAKLKLFWTKSENTLAWKVQVMNALFRSKMLYSLETTALNEGQIRRLDAFQVMMLRRCLRVPPTHVDRTVTNDVVLARVEEQTGKGCALFSFWYRMTRIKLLGHLIRAPDIDPLRQVTFSYGIAPPIRRKYRVGRPRKHWIKEVYSDLAAVLGMPCELHDGSPLLQAAQELATGREGPFRNCKMDVLWQEYGHTWPPSWRARRPPPFAAPLAGDAELELDTSGSD